MNSKREIAIYRERDAKIHLDVIFEGETVWLSQKQLSLLFGTERSVITKHLGNIFKNK